MEDVVNDELEWADIIKWKRNRGLSLPRSH